MGYDKKIPGHIQINSGKGNIAAVFWTFLKIIGSIPRSMILMVSQQHVKQVATVIQGCRLPLYVLCLSVHATHWFLNGFCLDNFFNWTDLRKDGYWQHLICSYSEDSFNKNYWLCRWVSKTFSKINTRLSLWIKFHHHRIFKESWHFKI